MFFAQAKQQTEREHHIPFHHTIESVKQVLIIKRELNERYFSQLLVVVAVLQLVVVIQLLVALSFASGFV